MAAIAPLVEEWLARNTLIAFGCGYRQKDENQAGNIRLLAERSGISDRRLYAIRRGYDKKTIGRNGKTYQSFGMRFAAADRLLCAMDMNERWHTDLADYYEFDERGPVAAAGSPSSRAANDGSRATEIPTRKAA